MRSHLGRNGFFGDWGIKGVGKRTEELVTFKDLGREKPTPDR